MKPTKRPVSSKRSDPKTKSVVAAILAVALGIREFKQITTAGATTAAVTEKVWGEYF